MAKKISVIPAAKVKPFPIILLAGPEEFFVQRSIETVKNTLKSKHPELEITEIDGPQYTSGTLLTAASPSLFAEPRLIIITEADKISDAGVDDMLQYCDMLAEDTTLIYQHGGGMRGKKVLDKIRSLGADAIEVDCAELKRDSDRQQFVQLEIQSEGRTITPQAVRILLTAFSANLTGLAAACQQLVSDTEGTIDEDTVNTYYADRAEINAFQVLDAALVRDTKRALILLRQSLESGVDAIPITAAIANKIRTMALVTYEKQTGEPSGLKLPDWLKDRARRDLNGWTDQGLARVIVAAAEVDAGLKGASKQPEYLLERLVELISYQGQP